MNFRDFFSPLQQEVISNISLIVPDRVFAVGGIVRDYLLGKAPRPIDLDLVIEGDGIAVAEELHQVYPQTKLQTHPKFLTAELLFPEFTLDLATARREIYPEPGANPIVTACSLWEDLERRDFTVNALAIQIRPNFRTDGDVIDRFDGLNDLDQKLIRAIRSGSFVEDPRRIFRAIRFAVKLNFEIDLDTLTEIKDTIGNGIHTNLGGSRFRSELLYIFHPSFFPRRSALMLIELDRLNAFVCIHENLHIPDQISMLLRRLHRWHSCFLPDYNCQELALELILSSLPISEATKAELIRGEAVKHLTKLPKLLARLESLARLPPSQVFDGLQSYELPTIVLAAVLSKHRKIIWQYLTKWHNFIPLVRGNDLQQWGCPPGKTIGIYLKQLRSLQLDGKLHSHQQAEQLVKTWNNMALK